GATNNSVPLPARSYRAARSIFRESRLSSKAFQILHCTRVGPILRDANKPSSYRIIPDIIPFLRVPFFRAQDVIKEFALPQRGGRGRRLRRKSIDPATGPGFPFTHEIRKVLGPRIRRAKEMHVVRHDHVRPDRPSVALARMAEFFYQNVGDGDSRQDWSTPKGADRDEIDRKVNPYAIKALQVLMHPLTF